MKKFKIIVKGYLTEIYQKRNLIWNFGLMDLKLRYRNSILGFFWSILEPLLLLTVLYVVFSYILRSDIPNYPIFLLIGLIFWNTFSRTTSMSTNSILAKKGIILSVPLPKNIFPVSAFVTSFLMMCFEMIIFVIFLIAFQFSPPQTILLLPLVFVPLSLISLGLAMPLASLNVMYRDVTHIWTVALQAGFFLTPIIYKITILPEEFRQILMLNPMAHIVTWSQNLVLFGEIPDANSVIYTFSLSVLIFVIGFFISYKYEKKIVDKL